MPAISSSDNSKSNACLSQSDAHAVNGAITSVQSQSQDKEQPLLVGAEGIDRTCVDAIQYDEEQEAEENEALCTSDVTALLTRLRLQREQGGRRLFSQRSLGAAQAIADGHVFLGCLNALREEDTLLLMCLSNAHLFGRLCDEVRQSSQCPTHTPSSPLVRVGEGNNGVNQDVNTPHIASLSSASSHKVSQAEEAVAPTSATVVSPCCSSVAAPASSLKLTVPVDSLLSRVHAGFYYACTMPLTSTCALSSAKSNSEVATTSLRTSESATAPSLSSSFHSALPRTSFSSSGLAALVGMKRQRAVWEVKKDVHVVRWLRTGASQAAGLRPNVAGYMSPYTTTPTYTTDVVRGGGLARHNPHRRLCYTDADGRKSNSGATALVAGVSANRSSGVDGDSDDGNNEDHDESGRKHFTVRAEAGWRRKGEEKDGVPSSSPSHSAGLVAQSMRAWEAHLTRQLATEGETVNAFRQGRNRTSYVERQRFQQAAQWNEYQQELRLQETLREQERRRLRQSKQHADEDDV